MTFRDLLIGTSRNIRAHKLRAALTMFGIAWGVVSITLMVAAGEGLRVGQQKQAETFGRNLMIVFAGRTSLQAGGARAGRLVRWRSTDHTRAPGQSPACEWVIPELGRGGTPVRSLYNSGALLVTGSHPPFAEIRSIPVEQGRFYSWEDEAQGRRVAFLGSDAKRQLFATRPAVGETVWLAELPYTVIGVMEHKEQDSSYDGQDVSKIFVPLSAMMRDFPQRPPLPRDSIDRLLVTPASVAQHEACKDQVVRALARIHGFDPRDEEAARVWDTVENAKAFHKMTAGMQYFLGAVGVITLLLGGIGVMNVMLVAVRERTREIGVRKAVGATRGSILRLFFVEALVIVLLSGGAGLAAAHGICALVNQIDMPPYFAGLLATWKTGALSIALLGSVALFSAMYPAGRAAAVDPIEALRHEGGG